MSPTEIRYAPVPGFTSRHILRGHTGTINRIAWSPDGHYLASPSNDSTIRIWDTKLGECKWKLAGHGKSVSSVAWSADSATLVSGAADASVRLWDIQRGRQIKKIDFRTNDVNRVAWSRDGKFIVTAASDHAVSIWSSTSYERLATMRGHTANVFGLAMSPDGLMIASGGGIPDNSIRIWSCPTGIALATLSGHTSVAMSLAFSPSTPILVSGSSDKSLRVWDTHNWKEKAILEGHTDSVQECVFDPSGELLASKSQDGTIRIWQSATWETLAILPVAGSGLTYETGVAFHPHLPRLATVEGDFVRIWDFDPAIVLGQARQSVHYTTAKLVLVGDSGVGKTGLGWRLAHGHFKEHSSTHGQQFWLIAQLGLRRSDGTDCEAVLWDLAGQPDYRLIHALFLDDSDLVLVLFDPTDSRDPLHGVEFWLKQLRIGQSGNAPRTLLVAARSDRGAATLTQEELEAFCRQRQIRGYLSTSAKNGEGVNDLIEQMKMQIPWDTKSATVTTTTFRRIKDHVLQLKENQQRDRVVLSPAELRVLLEKGDEHWQFSDAEMLTAVGHLENHGYVKRLRTSRGDTCILLAPELLNNLAASFILEARRNPKGLGSLEEKRLLAGEYSFSELAGLANARDLLLDSAALLFMEHNVCFRETSPLTMSSYLVFPELINLKRPTIADEKPTEDGVSYTVSGAVENVYASLVVLLGYTQTFTRTDQWRCHARYEVGDGHVCGFRQDAEREGELDFVLYFCSNVSQPIRALFQSLFESFLEHRNLLVYRYEPVTCPKGHELSRHVVREQLLLRANFAFCPQCGQKTTLPRANRPIQLTREQQTEMETQRRIADLRSRFEQAIFRVQSFANQQGIKIPNCFISYAWGEQEQERWVELQLATDLQKSGIDVVLDVWENARTGASVARFVERLEKSDYVVVVGTPLYRKKYDNRDSKLGFVVAAEGDLINNRMLGTESDKDSVLPVLLAGTVRESFPPLLHGRMYANFLDPTGYFTTAFDLILRIYDIAPSNPAVADLREMLRQKGRN